MNIIHSIIAWYYKKCAGKFYHRDKCRKKGRCIKCGRYICEGCNADINEEYGYCMKCASQGKYKLDTILPIKPLIKPKNIIQYYVSCNNRPEGLDF